MNAAEYYRAHLGLINDAISMICRKHGMTGDEARDFSQHVHLQLMEDDYRKLRAFLGSSSLTTYLYTVISRIFIDQIRERWHPSAEAKRLGAAAVKLEQLIYRDRHTVQEACQILAADPATALTEQAAGDILGKLRRFPRSIIVDDSNEHLPRIPDPSPDPEECAMQQEHLKRKHRIVSVIGESLRSLSEEDKLLIRLLYGSGHKISEIARLLGTNDRPLYRKAQTILRQLREALMAAGIGQVDVQELLHDMSDYEE